MAPQPLSALTSAFGVLQCEALLVMVQLGVDSPEQSGSNVNLGYSQQAVSQSHDPSSELTGQSDFASWCAVYLALAIAADAVIVALVYRRTVVQACKRACRAVSPWTSRLAAAIARLLYSTRLVLARRTETGIERADPQRVRRDSVVDLIKARLFQIRSRGPQPGIGAEAQLPGTTRQDAGFRLDHQTVLHRKSVLEGLAGQRPFDADDSASPSLDELLSQAAADCPQTDREQQQQPVQRHHPKQADLVGSSLAPLPLSTAAVDLSEVSWKANSASTVASSVSVCSSSAAFSLWPTRPLRVDVAVEEEKAAPPPNFRLVRLPVLVNPRLPVTESSPPLSSAPRTPTAARSVRRQAQLSRRHLSLSPTGRLLRSIPTSSSSSSSSRTPTSDTRTHVLYTPTALH